MNLKIKKRFCFFLLLLFSVNATAQNAIKDLKLKENTIYVFCRGTKTKAGLIAGKFNIKDTLITHVGIGFIEKKVLKIYNVIDCDDSKTALVIENLKSFICERAYYLSVWECKNNQQEFLKLKEACHKQCRQKVYFDYSFNLKNDNILYCSEFCSRMLKKANSVKFNFHPKKMKLESFYKTVLRREVLIYYPVDFFQDNKNFSKIFETNFNIKKS